MAVRKTGTTTGKSKRIQTAKENATAKDKANGSAGGGVGTVGRAKMLTLECAVGPVADDHEVWECWSPTNSVLDRDYQRSAAAQPVECLDGAGACPIEDVGGPIGYREFLDAMADRRHPEHRAMIRASSTANRSTASWLPCWIPTRKSGWPERLKHRVAADRQTPPRNPAHPCMGSEL